MRFLTREIKRGFINRLVCWASVAQNGAIKTIIGKHILCIRWWWLELSKRPRSPRTVKKNGVPVLNLGVSFILRIILFGSCGLRIRANSKQIRSLTLIGG